MTRHLWLRAAFAFLVISGASCLRDVSLEVDPEVVQRGQKVILRCYYDLEKSPLYSLKWYRGKYEFYRYTPSEEPVIKVFNISGIYVDLANSNKSQVALRDVDFPLGGTFSCEVTTDVTFTTISVSKNLTVVSLPEGTPIIVSERERYEVGDTLKANCSLPPSRPPADLSFTLNNVAVKAYKQHTPRWSMQQHRWDNNDAGSHADSPENRQWIEIRVDLQQMHFNHGQLFLRCTARIPGIYSADSILQLGNGLREPVPERVTSENGSEAPTAVYLTMLMLCILQLLLR